MMRSLLSIKNGEWMGRMKVYSLCLLLLGGVFGHSVGVGLQAQSNSDCCVSLIDCYQGCYTGFLDIPNPDEEKYNWCIDNCDSLNIPCPDCPVKPQSVTIIQQKIVGGGVASVRAKKCHFPSFGHKKRVRYRNIVRFKRAQDESNIVAYQVFVRIGDSQDPVLVGELPVKIGGLYQFKQLVRDPHLPYDYCIRSIDSSGLVIGQACAKIKGLRPKNDRFVKGTESDFSDH